jgi:hypothetical protein
LKLSFVLHDYPSKFLEYLPKFKGEDHVASEKHIESFERFTDLFEIMHEDVFMRTFCQSLQGDVRIWFKNLGADLVSSWVYLCDVFLRYWGEKKSYDQYFMNSMP